MSTELKASSKAYDLTRVHVGMGCLGVAVGNVAVSGLAITLSIPAIEAMIETADFSRVQDSLNLLDETMVLLKYDLARFVISKGNGMEIGY